MSIDFSQFGAAGNIDQSVLDNQGDGNFTLPDMKDCVLVITDVGSLSNDSGWQAANFEVQVANDGASGEHNGRTTKYSITLANPNFPEGAQWGIEELKRWAAACGITQLSSSDQLVGKQFMCNVGSKPNKKDPTKKDQTIRMLRPVGMTSAPANNMQSNPMQNNMTQQQPAGFAPQQQPAANPFPQGQQQPQQAPQQGGMPDWSQPR